MYVLLNYFTLTFPFHQTASCGEIYTTIQKADCKWPLLATVVLTLLARGLQDDFNTQFCQIHAYSLQDDLDT